MREVFDEKQVAINMALEKLKPSRMSRFVDTLLEPIAPGLVVRRDLQRQELAYRQGLSLYQKIRPMQVRLGYKALEPSFSHGTVSEPLMTEEAYFPGWQRFQMIVECRDLFRNSPIISAGVKGQARRTVATGINLRMHTSNKKWNKLCMRRWFAWCDRCDLRGLTDFSGVLRQVIRSNYVDGDMGIIYINDRGELKLQLIEGDLIAPDMRVSINIDTVNPIGGVILDWTTGRPLGYYVGKRGVGGVLQDSKIVGAESMLVPFRAQRVDQVRGVPLLAPVIDTAKDLEFYLEATRMQANIAATFGVFITRNDAAQFKTMETEQIGNLPDWAGRQQRLSTGMQTWLRPGEKAEMMDPKVPGVQFEPTAKFFVRQIAIGMGTTYEYLMQDFSNMSFSSSKTNLMDTTLTLRENQRYLKRGVCEPTFCRWLAMEMASGALPFNPEGYTEHSWDLPAELGIDPVKTADADIKRLAAGLDTIEGIIAPNGEGDLEAHLTRRADEVALIDRLAEERGLDPSRIASWLTPGVAAPTQAPPQ